MPLPDLGLYVLSPAARSYASIGSNQTAQDYEAADIADSGTIFYIQPDHLNTPRAVYNDLQQLRWKWDQAEPFGVNVPDENPASLGVFEMPLRYPGQYADTETGQSYNYLRDCYDPAIGRYCESDPIGLIGGLNTYEYVDSNTLSFTDPLGLEGGGVGQTIYRVDALRFVAYAGPSVGGTEHAIRGPGQAYHFHIKGPDIDIRIDAKTFQPLTPEDQEKFKGKVKGVCENLKAGERQFIHRATREVFHEGKLTPKQMMRMGELRGMRASGVPIPVRGPSE